MKLVLAIHCRVVKHCNKLATPLGNEESCSDHSLSGKGRLLSDDWRNRDDGVGEPIRGE
jgi:hypothetical protein